jgi:exopolysaccharide production protein ExoY
MTLRPDQPHPRGDARTGFGQELFSTAANIAAFAAYPPPVPLWKRAFDLLFSVGALLFFAPFMLAVAAAILLRERGPVFYAQERIGHGGRPFRCLKFRTMVRDADAQLAALLARDPAARAEWEATRKLTHDPRISCIGNVLRKTSLDELPQFLNVLRGQMSVVGPRPIVAEEAEFYRDDFLAYKAVRPGITGIWQVSGRSNTTYAERVAMDVHYVAHQSLWLDIGIVARTVSAVVLQVGAR